MVNGFKWPCFEDGEPIQFDDEFVTDAGITSFLTTITLTASGDAGLNHCALLEEDKAYVRSGGFVKRPVQKKDLDGIIEDGMMMSPLNYCAERLGWTSEDCVRRGSYKMRRAMIEDMLRRQRELLEKED